MQAERCSLFLVDKKNRELVAKVFDGNILADGSAEVSKYTVLYCTVLNCTVPKLVNINTPSSIYKVNTSEAFYGKILPECLPPVQTSTIFSILIHIKHMLPCPDIESIDIWTLKCLSFMNCLHVSVETYFSVYFDPQSTIHKLFF